MFPKRMILHIILMETITYKAFDYVAACINYNIKKNLI